MPARELILDSDPCTLADKWGVDLNVMERVWYTADRFTMETGGIRVYIISGYRSAAEQRRLSRQGRPTAPDALSTHRSCPATGVDISLGGLLASEFMKVTWGRLAGINGLRWGGGGPVDPENLIPLDWRHVDRGPRR